MKDLRYRELDALRGFAALYVVFFHYTTHTPYSLPIAELGVTGVDLFFIISGFVIFMSINKVSTARQFIVNRFARLYPTYWTAVTFTTLLFFAVNHFYAPGNTITAYTYFANMTMFQHYLRAENIDGTYWTMIIEMVFYIFILLLFKTKLLKYILPLGLGVLAFAVFWDTWIESHSVAAYKIIRYMFPLVNHFPLFLAGIIFYNMANNKQSMLQYVILALCLPVQAMLYNNGGSAQHYISQLHYGIMLVCYFLVFFLFVNHKLGFIVNRPALFFGKISFALYLIHQYVSIDVIIPLLTKELQINFWLAALAAFAVSVGTSALITYYIEAPAGKKIRTIFSTAKK